MKRSRPLARGKGLQRRSRLAATRKPAEQVATETFVREAVTARDGGCLMARIEPERCFGRLTFHHLHKSGAGGDYTEANGCCLCVGHNDDVEDHPIRYRELGLVVRPGIDHQEAAERRLAAGLGPRRTDGTVPRL